MKQISESILRALISKELKSILHEGEVIQFPTTPSEVPYVQEPSAFSKLSVEHAVRIEFELGRILDKIYGGTLSIPLEKIKMLDQVADMIQNLLNHESGERFD